MKKDSDLAVAAFSGDLATYAPDSASPAARDRLMRAVARLCRVAHGTLIPSDAADQVSGLTHNLLSFSDPETRLRLAEDIATSPWPSQKLIWALATGPIDSAAPVLRASPVLDQADLCALIGATGPDHHIEIARRKSLPAPVIDLLIAGQDAAVLTVVAESESFDLTEGQRDALVSAARRVTALRKPLVQHRDLSRPQACSLYGYCDLPLRQALALRFELNTQGLEAALVKAHHVEDLLETGTNGLIVKLQMSGQLTTGYLVRALRDDRLSAFLSGLACLADLPLSGLRTAIDAPSAEPLALACRAVGMDRTVFPQVLQAVRRLNGGLPFGSSDDGSRIDQAFGGVSAHWAARAFTMLGKNQV